MSKKIDSVFPNQLKGIYVGKGQWKLEAPFRYNDPPTIMVKVPAGYVTDGASIPKFAYSLIGGPWTGRYARAAVVHDYLCFSQIVPRKKADRIFLQAMKILKVNWFKRWLMYRAVSAMTTALKIKGWFKK